MRSKKYKRKSDNITPTNFHPVLYLIIKVIYAVVSIYIILIVIKRILAMFRNNKMGRNGRKLIEEKYLSQKNGNRYG